MSLSTIDKVFMYVGIIDLAGMFAWLGYALLYCHKNINGLIAHFERSSAVQARVGFLRSGPWGKLFVLSGVVSVILHPKKYLKKGMLDAEELNSLPKSIRNELAILHRCSIILLVVMLGLYGMVVLEFV